MITEDYISLPPDDARNKGSLVETLPTQVLGGGRYCLTYEEWLDMAVHDPEGYGMTKERAVAERESYYMLKKGVEPIAEISNKQEQPGEQDGTPQET